MSALKSREIVQTIFILNNKIKINHRLQDCFPYTQVAFCNQKVAINLRFIANKLQLSCYEIAIFGQHFVNKLRYPAIKSSAP